LHGQGRCSASCGSCRGSRLCSGTRVQAGSLGGAVGQLGDVARKDSSGGDDGAYLIPPFATERRGGGCRERIVGSCYAHDTVDCWRFAYPKSLATSNGCGHWRKIQTPEALLHRMMWRQRITHASWSSVVESLRNRLNSGLATNGDSTSSPTPRSATVVVGEGPRVGRQRVRGRTARGHHP